MATEGHKRRRNVLDVLEQIKTSKPTGPRNVLIRVDFNVPTDPSDHTVITDDSRIRAAIPTIKAVSEGGCNAIVCSHMGRPKAVQKDPESAEAKAQKEKLSLKVAADRLAKLTGKEVSFATDCIGEPAETAVAGLPAEGGAVLVLENLRFRKAEEKNDDEFAKSLAKLADAYVNDAFGTSHRAHASTAGVPAVLPTELCGLGLLVQSEVDYLDFSNMEEGSTVTAIIGGSKVSTKLPVIKGLLNQVDTLVLGGGLAFTFLRAQGITIGTSLVEDEMVDTAKELLKEAEEKNKKILLPVDSVCSQSFPSGPMDKKDTKTFDLVPGGGIEDGWMGLDCGPKSITNLKANLTGCTKLVMNGPMGVFEIAPFDEGTKGLVDILEDLTKAGTVTVVGGGDSVAALEQFGKVDAVSYVSTGGGATLELLSGEQLPGVVAISEIDA